jgi:hypothetical protein
LDNIGFFADDEGIPCYAKTLIDAGDGQIAWQNNGAGTAGLVRELWFNAWDIIGFSPRGRDRPPRGGVWGMVLFSWVLAYNWGDHCPAARLIMGKSAL